MTITFFDGDNKLLSNFEIAPKNFFVFFSAISFCTYIKFFQKKKQILIFCVHNLILDRPMLGFFFDVWLFSKTFQTPIASVWHVYVCLDQYLVI